MKGLIACFTIVCLSLASGAPTDEHSKFYSKSFNYGKNEVFYSWKPFSNEELAYAVCEGKGADQKCKVFVESTNQGENIVKSCDVDQKYTGRFDSDSALFNAGSSKAVFAFRDSPTKIKLVSVNLKDCRINEASVDLPDPVTEESAQPIEVFVVGRENNYDVIFHNKQLCHGFLCKATFDYEGKVVKAASSFPVKDSNSSLYEIKSINDAYLVSEIDEKSTRVHWVHDEDTKPNTLFSGGQGIIGLTTEENKVGYCVHGDQKLTFKQYDAEGKSKKIEAEITTGKGEMEFLDAHNLDKGLLILSVERDADTNNRNVFVVHFDEQGRQGKYVSLDQKCNKEDMLLSKLYKNSNGDYCVSSICIESYGSSENHLFTRNTRCFLKTELF